MQSSDISGGGNSSIDGGIVVCGCGDADCSEPMGATSSELKKEGAGAAEGVDCRLPRLEADVFTLCDGIDASATFMLGAKTRLN